MAPAAPRPPRPPRPRGSFKRGLRRALREPFTRRNLRECRYAGVGLLVAIPLFAFTAVAFTVSLALSVSFAGLPLLALSLRAARRLGENCRRLANRALGPRAESRGLVRQKQARPIDPPPPLRPQPGFVGWIRSSLTDAVSWRACGYLLLKLPIALLGGIGLIYIVAWGVGYSTFPVWWSSFTRSPPMATRSGCPGGWPGGRPTRSWSPSRFLPSRCPSRWFRPACAPCSGPRG